ncbi:MAG: ATP-binding cassette domain-containing protein [Campylobacterales bacterium]|jgi:molybdate transport system ATP-binding protein|nr:ATP-binding cassette domain-containing protein [Campylobacterales bacterium]NLM99615.1 ATP-binding cassette domain-containing protein [Campylobacteraceae bacterium]
MIKINIKKPLHGANGKMDLNVDLTIEKGSFVALSGESGSGKTTLLRILAGLTKAKGEIYVDGECWHDKKIFLPPQKREIGFVFQDYALFPNMSVEENLLYVKKDQTLAKKLLDMTELTNMKDRYPASLSGGQQQRVSLCRAMMNSPKLLLMDEPLSALNPAMRGKLQQEIFELHNSFGTTTIMVSHDPSEMYRLANRVIVLENGETIADGVPKDILLKTSGSQKFSFEGELLDIVKMDVIYVAIVSIGQQLVEVVLSSVEAQSLKVGQRVRVSTKAFAPIIKH